MTPIQPQWNLVTEAFEMELNKVASNKISLLQFIIVYQFVSVAAARHHLSFVVAIACCGLQSLVVALRGYASTQLKQLFNLFFKFSRIAFKIN